MAEYTDEQENVVRKVLKIEKSDYYKILDVERSATEVEIKKSYRRLAIKLHPDKNKHPKSSEAFKRLAKLFEVLSDADKKRIYDQTGFDPDARGGGAGGGGGGSTSGFSQGASSFPFQRGAHPFAAGGNSGMFSEDDILNFMFGGNGNGGPSPFSTFGNGNGFTFSFGGPGNNPFSGFQQQHLRQRQRQNLELRRQSMSPWEQLQDTIRQLLPILILVLIPLISSFFGGDDQTSLTGSRLPVHSFDPQPLLPVERLTFKHKIPYYINEKTFTNNGGYQDSNSAKLRTLDRRVENNLINDLKYKCHNENLRKQDAILDSSFFIWTNQKKLDEANAMGTPSCDRLSGLGLL